MVVRTAGPGAPGARQVEKGTLGTEEPQEELQAETEGIEILSAVSGPTVGGRGSLLEWIVASSGKATFSRLGKSGLRLLSRRYDVEVFEEARLDALCGFSSW